MGRKNRNARLKPRVYEKYEFKPEPGMEPTKPPEPVLQIEQPISHGGGYKHTWMIQKGAEQWRNDYQREPSAKT